MEEVKHLGEVKGGVQEEPKVLKVKKPRSEKQIEAFKKAKENRLKNIEINNNEKKRLLEEKILSKAISIKKKQIKKQFKSYDLDSVSDDETPIEDIKEKQRAITPPPVRPIQHIQTPIKVNPVEIKKSFTFL